MKSANELPAYVKTVNSHVKPQAEVTEGRTTHIPKDQPNPMLKKRPTVIYTMHTSLSYLPAGYGSLDFLPGCWWWRWPAWWSQCTQVATTAGAAASASPLSEPVHTAHRNRVTFEWQWKVKEMQLTEYMIITHKRCNIFWVNPFFKSRKWLHVLYWLIKISVLFNLQRMPSPSAHSCCWGKKPGGVSAERTASCGGGEAATTLLVWTVMSPCLNSSPAHLAPVPDQQMTKWLFCWCCNYIQKKA